MNFDDINELIAPNFTQLDLIPTLFGFFMCVLMSFIVRDFYIKRSFSLTGKMHIGSIIPVLSTVVFLVIVVVKSSLALSLGLVGALSIVRFRTPIRAWGACLFISSNCHWSWLCGRTSCNYNNFIIVNSFYNLCMAIQ